MTTFPIRNWSGTLPESYIHPGGFGTQRKFDVHTGIDLYCPNDTTVYAMKSGTVVGTFQFTGKEVGSPWWNTTYATVIQSRDKIDEYLLYGEIKGGLKAGTVIHEGDVVGFVSQVLKKDKGKPMSMLHFEVYNSWEICYDGAVWKLGEAQPLELENPYTLLENC